MKTTFILGAGFSTASGAPKEKHIIPKIFSFQENEKLAQNIKKILFLDNSDWIKEISFNQILSRLDLIRYYRPYKDLDYNLVEDTEQQLIKQMVRLLEPSMTNKNNTLYKNFILTSALKADFISFNYDLILENTLNDLGVNFDLKLKIKDSQKIDNSKDNTRNVLKLHGSIDLVFCPHCKNIYRRETWKADVLYCPNCIDKNIVLQHFLVAPTLYKSYELPAIRDLWYEGLKLLMQSNNIYFIGYSLSPEDILAYQMLDTAFRMAHGEQRVWLVNGPRYNPRKIKSIYHNNVENTGLYFEDWIKKV